MTNHYQTIPNAEKRIQSLIKKINFVPDEKAIPIHDWITDRRRFYMPSGSVPRYRRAFLKARLQNTKDIVQSLRRETVFYDSIVPLISSSRYSFILPRHISHGNESGLFWLLREYIPGELAGQMDLDFGFTHRFLLAASPVLAAQNITALHAATAKIAQRIKLERHGSFWYIGIDHAFYKNSCLKRIHWEEIAAIGRILQSHKKLLDAEAKFVEHGDLYPNNFLLCKQKICLLDWELIHLNNCAFAPAFIYLNAWRSPSWQRKFLKSFAQKTISPAFPQLFRVALCSLLLRLMRYEYVVWQYYEQGKITDQNITVRNVFKTQKPKAAIAAFKYHKQTLQTILNRPEKFFTF